MKLVQSGNKWVLYNSNGQIVIITTDKRIAERMMQNGNDAVVKVAAQVPTKTLEETSMNSPVSPLSPDAQQLQDA